MSWVISQIGAREHYALAVQLGRLGRLNRLVTDFWAPAWLTGELPFVKAPALKRFQGRHHTELRTLVTSFNVAATAARLLSYGRRRKADVYLGHLAYGEWFSKRAAAYLDQMRKPPRYFFTFTTGGMEALSAARGLGSHTIVDQIDAARVDAEIVEEERELFPGWEDTPLVIPEAYWSRLKAEWASADTVLVNSDFVRSALVKQGLNEDKIVVLPLAYERPSSPPERTRGRAPLRVLYLGGLTLRKGIQYVVQAAAQLPAIEFHVAGPSGLSAAALRSFPANLRLHGYVPRVQTAALFRNADLFIQPTLSDGFAITQLEAMGRGLPVIATPNCGRVVTDGYNGYVVPIRSADALVEAIDRLDRDRELLASLAANAYCTAGRYSLERVVDDLLRSVVRRESRPAVLTE